jgi:hypothetical protein
MAKSYYDNNGDLKRFGLVAAGVGSRWFQTYYVNKMQTDLYDLTRQSPAHAAELKQFLRGKMVKDNLVMPKSFSEINKDLPEILARMGTKMGAEALAKNAKAWVYNKHDYEDFINKLLNGKGDDDDDGVPLALTAGPAPAPVISTAAAAARIAAAAPARQQQPTAAPAPAQAAGFPAW